MRLCKCLSNSNQCTSWKGKYSPTKHSTTETNSTHFGPQLQPSMRRNDVFRVKVGNQILVPKISNPHMKMKLPSLFETQLGLSRLMCSISFLTLTHIIVTHWFKVNKIICLLDLQEIYCNSCYYLI